MHISEAKCSLLSLLSFKYFLSQRISSGTKQNDERNMKGRTPYLILFLPNVRDWDETQRNVLGEAVLGTQ